ncbi:hypothetical protein BaRGS_00019325, partial [Batillaria attramentaria]
AQQLLTENTEACLELIREWFPDRALRTYFLPNVHMNKMKYRETDVSGVQVQAVLTAEENRWRDDEVMQRVLHCLRHLTDVHKEPMVVLLQMKHENYLHKSRYKKVEEMFPRPRDFGQNFGNSQDGVTSNTEKSGLRRGELDFLFLHKEHGIIVAEVKSVGWIPGREQTDVEVARKVQEGLTQLDKADEVLHYLVSDLTPTPRVRKTLILPNVSRERLQALLENNDLDLKEKFIKCLDAEDVTSAIACCLCSDQMTTREDPSNVTDAILKSLRTWWRHLTASPESCTPEIYDLLLARFCGPASTVEVYCATPPPKELRNRGKRADGKLEFRTLGDAVAETGERMVKFALLPDQLAMLDELEKQQDSGLEQVYLTGPPGTGKTLVLMLVVIIWAIKGEVVHVISTGSYSEAATQLVYYQIHLNGNSNDNRAPFEALVKAATSQKQEAELNDTNNNTAKKGKLFIVADEVDGLFRDFLEGLQKELPDVGLHVWAATYHHKHRPPGMAEKTLSSSLRCPPVVMRRVKTAVSFTNSAIYPFDALTSKNQVPTDGPPELHLSHKGHSEPDAMNCEECDLNVGGRGLKQHPSVHGVNSPPALKFSDVIVVPDYYQDEHKTLDEVVDPTSGK